MVLHTPHIRGLLNAFLGSWCTLPLQSSQSQGVGCGGQSRPPQSDTRLGVWMRILPFVEEHSSLTWSNVQTRLQYANSVDLRHHMRNYPRHNI